MSDARIATAFPSHPKTKKLLRRLGEAGPLGCLYLFLWAAQNRSDGDLAGLSDEDLELAVDWRGEPGALITAMADVGYLDGQEGERSSHDWTDHNPYAAGAEARSEKARWASLCRRQGRDEAARQMPEYAARLAATSRESAATSSVSPATGNGLAVLDSASRSESACPVSGSVSVSVSGSVSGSGTGTRAKASAPSSGADFRLLTESGIDPDLARDFLAVRRAKKAPLTPTALAGIVREAGKAKLSLEAALRVCCERGWSGYKADWPGARGAVNGAAAPERRRELL
jgi:hypothetical protein